MWLVLVAGLSSAADPAPLVARVEAHYAGVTTLQAGFVQTVHSPTYGDDVQRGRMVLQRPGKMRWDFTGDGRVFLSDGTTLTVWQPDVNQVMRYPYTPGGPDSLLQSLDHVGELYTVTAPDPQPASGAVLDLVPKQADGTVAKVRLTLSASLDLQKVELTDPVGTRTELVFSDVKTGGTVDAATFTFVPPKGAQVISGG